jgi:hypothetical protein
MATRGILIIMVSSLAFTLVECLVEDFVLQLLLDFVPLPSGEKRRIDRIKTIIE